MSSNQFSDPFFKKWIIQSWNDHSSSQRPIKKTLNLTFVYPWIVLWKVKECAMFQNVVIHFQFFVLKPSYNFLKCNKVTIFLNVISVVVQMLPPSTMYQVIVIRLKFVRMTPRFWEKFLSSDWKSFLKVNFNLGGGSWQNYFVLSYQMTFRKDGQHCVDEDLIIIIKV